MKQTGFLYKEDPNDFILGNSPIIWKEVSNGDWTIYLPEEEKQYKDFTFDTMSCTTFSALNVVETWLNSLLEEMSIQHLEEFNKLGVIENGKFNFSDRFTAIMSRTMPNGNYLPVVLNSIRKDGLLSEKDLPFGGNNWNEYHGATITQEMKDKAKKILDLIEVNYEWVNMASDWENELKKCPLQGAIPVPGTHAVMIHNKGEYFDTYIPFVKKYNKVHYAMKIQVKLKPIPNEEVSVRILRENGNSKYTKGFIMAKKGGNKFSCYTLELPWRNNQRNISCIPVGRYPVKWTFSPRFMRFTYEILNVPNRSGIRIHPGNYVKNLKGCIYLGSKFADIDNDKVDDIINSGNMVRTFENFMEKKDFILLVENYK
jgi:hypothetical protein